ncbi:MAG TPA: hypothetical protein VFL96_06670 [Acidobacteriaceae bacterium]|jgi:hypothetical protein|nr:hypothetical protein [Acidobacteriaceae bacterium]
MAERQERARELAEEALATREEAERLVDEARRIDSQVVREVIEEAEEDRHSGR